jgi:hypothetical protein
MSDAHFALLARQLDAARAAGLRLSAEQRPERILIVTENGVQCRKREEWIAHCRFRGRLRGRIAAEFAVAANEPTESTEMRVAVTTKSETQFYTIDLQEKSNV